MIMRNSLSIGGRILVLFLFLMQTAFAQDFRSFLFPNGQYWKSYLTDTKEIVISPIKWKTGEWIAAGAVVGGTILLYQYDIQIQKYFQSKQTNWGYNLSKHGLERWGSGVYSLSTMAFFYGQGLIWKNRQSQKVALMGVKAFILSGLVVQFPKMLINRHRPYHDKPSRHDLFEGPTKKLYNSFPSGHTTSIFSVATVVASEYWDTRWVPVLAYSIATLSGISRLYDNKHWSSDVFLGAAFGYAIGKLVHSSENWKWNAYPFVGQGSASLSLTYRF